MTQEQLKELFTGLSNITSSDTAKLRSMVSIEIDNHPSDIKIKKQIKSDYTINEEGFVTFFRIQVTDNGCTKPLITINDSVIIDDTLFPIAERALRAWHNFLSKKLKQ